MIRDFFRLYAALRFNPQSDVRFVRNSFWKVLGGLGERVSMSIFGGCETVGEGSLSCFVDGSASVESLSSHLTSIGLDFLTASGLQ